MKIGIVTLHGYVNFGNRLQNFALQEAISKLGYEVESLVLSYPENVIKKRLRRFYKKQNGQIRLKKLNAIRREAKIEAFSKKNIRSKNVVIKDEFSKDLLNSEYDAFVVGSDQVWNPMFWGKSRSSIGFISNMLTFASEQKKVAYAGSFGISQLPDSWKESMAEEFKKFQFISVREETGRQIIYDLIGHEPPVVLDPTMLLSADEWKKKIAIQDRPGKYVLSFFIGNKNEETIKYIDQLKKNQIKVIDLMDVHDRRDYVSDPKEFLDLINNAEAVLTDSFHATVFSILFHTPFLTFGRIHDSGANMDSRISTLLEKFNLQEREFKGQQVDLFVCEFNGVDGILQEEREKSIFYLKSALRTVVK